MNFIPLPTALVFAAVIIALSGCVYRMDVSQGNRIDASVIEQLEIGMSKRQVEFLLGSPALVDLYQPDQWNYIYSFRKGGDETGENRVMSLHFNDDILVSIEGTVNPDP